MLGAVNSAAQEAKANTPQPQSQPYGQQYGGGYPQQGGGYPQQGGGYFQQGGGYPQQDGGHPQQGGGYPQQSGYGTQQGGYYPPPPQVGWVILTHQIVVYMVALYAEPLLDSNHTSHPAVCVASVLNFSATLIKSYHVLAPKIEYASQPQPQPQPHPVYIQSQPQKSSGAGAGCCACLAGG
nr:hypothetical protein L204_02829 [Cryptococcus depauperatus CBS 7855]